MIRVLIAAAMASVLGLALAGPQGGALGAVLGMGLGSMWHAARSRARPWQPGSAFVAREHVLCVPRGEPAHCDIVRDERTGRCIDVQFCSLQPERAPNCPMQCLDLMNDNPVPTSA